MIRLATAVLVMGCGWALLHQKPANALAQDDADLRELLASVRELSAAFVKSDEVAIKRLLADDQIAVLGCGAPESKRDQLEKLRDLKFESADLDDLRTHRISGDVIAVSYRLTREGVYKGQPLTPEVYVLAVWAKRGEHWRQVTYQETVPNKT